MSDFTSPLDLIAADQAQKEVTANAALNAASPATLYGRRDTTSALLTWGYYGGRWNGSLIANGTLALTASATNYIVALLSTGAVSVSTSSINFLDTANYLPLHIVTTDTVAATSWEDHRQAFGASTGGGGGGSDVQCIPIACSDETTALTTGAAKVTFRMPYAFTLTAVRASVTTAPTGSVLTVDINEGGTTILSTKITIDATEKTSTTAATAPVISDTSLADDAEMAIDIDTVGSTVAGAGLKVYLIGTKT